MYLKIDGHEIQAQPGESLLNLVHKLGLEGSCLSQRPLAAKLAGEVFTLNYIPLRKSDLQSDRSSVRRAMAASAGDVRLLYYGDAAGKECYIRTAQFVIFLAMRQLWPNVPASMSR